MRWCVQSVLLSFLNNLSLIGIFGFTPTVCFRCMYVELLSLRKFCSVHLLPVADEPNSPEQESPPGCFSECWSSSRRSRCEGSQLSLCTLSFLTMAVWSTDKKEKGSGAPLQNQSHLKWTFSLSYQSVFLFTPTVSQARTSDFFSKPKPWLCWTAWREMWNFPGYLSAHCLLAPTLPWQLTLGSCLASHMVAKGEACWLSPKWST